MLGPEQQIKDIAKRLGFSDCRIAPAKRATHADAFETWLAEGKHGEMAWLARTPERRCDPREVLEGCRSVITLALNYFPGKSPFPALSEKDYRVARYAWNEDYHDYLWTQLKLFDAELQLLGGTQRYYTDTGPVLERDFATDAGLGWNGKSTVQIHPKFGNWFFLSELLSTLELTPDQPFGDHCGKCTRCMVACPTQAITAPHSVDARRCISYLTIENKGSIPIEFRRAIGNRIYGCDTCLEVCPWNRFAQTSQLAIFHAKEEVFQHQLTDFLQLDDESFRKLFFASPIKRIKRHRFLRNVCVALGNVGTERDLQALQLAAEDPEPLISEHAQWAIAEIQQRQACQKSSSS